ncbi:MAG: hypothetical protein Q4B68_07070 [Bacteroidales bacterium]|nr:hypothetical protein [Bacteroidales bacterium]
MKKTLLLIVLAIATAVIVRAERVSEAAAKVISQRLTQGCSLQPFSVYEATAPAQAYLRPSLKAGRIKDEVIEKGAIMTETAGAASMTPHGTKWLMWDWRGDQFFYLKKNFKTTTYQCCTEINAFDHHKLTFTQRNGNKISIYRLNLDGHTLTREGEDKPWGNSEVWMVDYFQDGPDILHVENGKIQLCGMSTWITNDAGDPYAKSGVVVNGTLTCDGYVFAFGDADFSISLRYVPEKNAILYGGELYYLSEYE